MRNFAKYDFFLSKLLIDPFFRNAGVILIPFNSISNCEVVTFYPREVNRAPTKIYKMRNFANYKFF